jgi:hypothetical protein
MRVNIPPALLAQAKSDFAGTGTISDETICAIGKYLDNAASTSKAGAAPTPFNWEQLLTTLLPLLLALLEQIQSPP